MIVKDLDPFNSSDRLRRAGRAAEEQVAFYLKRAFESCADARVFNGLRLTKGDDAAQLDHLILHRTGVIVIESKSVTSEVVVNLQGEWARRWNGRLQGMPSPVEQARRQGRFLKLYLQDHVDELLDRVFGVLQKQVGSMSLDLLVAISDGGLIQRAPGEKLDEVCKADQLAGKAREIIDRRRRAASVFSLSMEGGYWFTDRELTRITAFLRAQHRPLQEPDSPPAPSVTPTPGAAELACRACGGADLEVLWGKFGYYLKCRTCRGNTPIKLTCSKCGGRCKVRKEGLRFLAECEACATSELFHVNPAATPA